LTTSLLLKRALRPTPDIRQGSFRKVEALLELGKPAFQVLHLVQVGKLLVEVPQPLQLVRVGGRVSSAPQILRPETEQHGQYRVDRRVYGLSRLGSKPNGGDVPNGQESRDPYPGRVLELHGQ
jgi:hypothetical protein